MYVDGSRYTGEWADGYEHGVGTRTYVSDGSSFEGRFRFGRRDGLGVLTLSGGKEEKRVFKDVKYKAEVPPPEVNTTNIITDTTITIFNPKTFLECQSFIAFYIIYLRILIQNVFKSMPPKTPPVSSVAWPVCTDRMAEVLTTHRDLYPSTRLRNRLW